MSLWDSAAPASKSQTRWPSQPWRQQELGLSFLPAGCFLQEGTCDFASGSCGSKQHPNTTNPIASPFLHLNLLTNAPPSVSVLCCCADHGKPRWPETPVISFAPISGSAIQTGFIGAVLLAPGGSTKVGGLSHGSGGLCCQPGHLSPEGCPKLLPRVAGFSAAREGKPWCSCPACKGPTERSKSASQPGVGAGDADTREGHAEV